MSFEKERSEELLKLAQAIERTSEIPPMGMEAAAVGLPPDAARALFEFSAKAELARQDSIAAAAVISAALRQQAALVDDTAVDSDRPGTGS